MKIHPQKNQFIHTFIQKDKNFSVKNYCSFKFDYDK